MLYLKEDQAFFDLLLRYMTRIKKFEDQRTINYNSDIAKLGKLISSVVSINGIHYSLNFELILAKPIANTRPNHAYRLCLVKRISRFGRPIS